MASLVGSRVERNEDKKLLTGRGKYTADVTFAHQTYAYFVRSPHARAQLKNVDISKANSNEIVRNLESNFIPNLLKDYPYIKLRDLHNTDPIF